MAKEVKPKQPQLKNCPYCHKLFLDNWQGYCADCAEKIREMEKRAIAYVEEHPRVSLKEVSEATEVPEKILSQMVERGQFIDIGAELSYPCSMCGRPIVEGVYCLSCRTRLLEELKRLKEQREERIKSGRDGIKAKRKRLSKEDFGSSRYKSILDRYKAKKRR